MQKMMGGEGGRTGASVSRSNAQLRHATRGRRAERGAAPVAAAPATVAAAAAPPAAVAGAGGGGAAAPAYPQAGQSPQPVPGAASSMGGRMLPGVA